MARDEEWKVIMEENSFDSATQAVAKVEDGSENN